jgi:hypothetical protein
VEKSFSGLRSQWGASGRPRRFHRRTHNWQEISSETFHFSCPFLFPTGQPAKGGRMRTILWSLLALVLLAGSPSPATAQERNKAGLEVVSITAKSYWMIHYEWNIAHSAEPFLLGVVSRRPRQIAVYHHGRTLGGVPLSLGAGRGMRPQPSTRQYPFTGCNGSPAERWGDDFGHRSAQ